MIGSAVVTAAVPAPSGYEELFSRDGTYIRKLVRQHLGPVASGEDVEDTVQYICEKIYARDVLGMYDPEDPSGAAWYTFLGRQVILYCRGQREDIGKRAKREPAQVDAPAGDGQVRWVDLYGPGEWDDYPVLDDDELVARLRAYLETVPDSWQPSGQVKLTDLFESVIETVRGGEKVNAASLGLSPSAARAGLTALRRALQPVCRRPIVLPAFAGGTFTVTREQVTAAIEVLESSKKGTAVRQPLARAGSPLAAMDYHAVAVAERAHYAKLKGEGGSRHDHVGHVKPAVLHRLRRLLAEDFAPPVAEPELELPPTDEEMFESELWHFPGMTPEKLDHLKDMARKLPR